MIKINNLSLTLEEDPKRLYKKAARRLGVLEGDILRLKIQRESLDARRSGVKHVYSVLVEVAEEDRVLRRLSGAKDVEAYRRAKPPVETPGETPLARPPVVVGFGPAGMFAALALAKAGYRPLVLERGESMDARDRTVDRFMTEGALCTESNIQFGEGGAGAYSDGKLTTRIRDPRVEDILAALVEAGAPEEILYQAKPHVGTDLLKEVVKSIRRRILALGGEVRFEARLEGITQGNGRLTAIRVNGEELETETLILCMGHSARDTLEMLYGAGVMMEAKSTAVGVRVENLQSAIDAVQYGSHAGHPRLRPAEYKLTAKAGDGRGVYSFCMCPGGYVVPAASEEGRLVVNGMSYHSRSGVNANSALVVSVTPRDYGPHPLDGLAYQRRLEERAFALGGGGYVAPVQLAADFLEGRGSSALGQVQPTYRPGVVLSDLGGILPKPVTKALQEGLRQFHGKMPGFAGLGAVLTGVETRTSSTVRVLRGTDLMSVNVKGLFPAGEGAGYAGGIVSSAVDGLKAAQALMAIYRPGD